MFNTAEPVTEMRQGVRSSWLLLYVLTAFLFSKTMRSREQWPPSA